MCAVEGSKFNEVPQPVQRYRSRDCCPAPAQVGHQWPSPRSTSCHARYWRIGSPSVPNLGGVTKIAELDIARLGNIDVLIFGSPCQDLSVAGNEKGLAGERSGLFTMPCASSDGTRSGAGCDGLSGKMSRGIQQQRWRRLCSRGWRIGGGVVDTPQRLGQRRVFLGPEALVEWSTLDAQWFGKRSGAVACSLSQILEIGPIDPGTSEPTSVRGFCTPNREAGQKRCRNSYGLPWRGVSGQSANAGLFN